jgi:hypothetical protein
LSVPRQATLTKRCLMLTFLIILTSCDHVCGVMVESVFHYRHHTHTQSVPSYSERHLHYYVIVNMNTVSSRVNTLCNFETTQHTLVHNGLSSATNTSLSNCKSRVLSFLSQ